MDLFFSVMKHALNMLFFFILFLSSAQNIVADQYNGNEY